MVWTLLSVNGESDYLVESAKESLLLSFAPRSTNSVFDDSTASLDAQTEANLKEALKPFLKVELCLSSPNECPHDC